MSGRYCYKSGLIDFSCVLLLLVRCYFGEGGAVKSSRSYSRT